MNSRVLKFIVEGKTEKGFVDFVLKPHFNQLNIGVSSVSFDGFGKDAKRYARFKNVLTKQISECKGDCWFTSMIDLYAFPTDNTGPLDDKIQSISDPYLKVDALEKAMYDDLNDACFIPYVQLHEFEALILAEPDKLSSLYPSLASNILSKIKNDIGFNKENFNPELINGGQHSAPSKRIIKHLEAYKGIKSTAYIVPNAIGLPVLREKCSHFNRWMTQLEKLSQ